MRPDIRVFVSALLWAGATLYGQTASITGTIIDATSARVPDAKVTATNQATASIRTAVTRGLQRVQPDSVQQSGSSQ